MYRCLIIFFVGLVVTGCVSNVPPATGTPTKSVEPQVELKSAEASQMIREEVTRISTRFDATSLLISQSENAIEQMESADAIKLIERALRLEPKNSGLWIKLAAANLMEGNLSLAAQQTNKALALSTNSGLRNLELTISAHWKKAITLIEGADNFELSDAIRNYFPKYTQ
jgi:Tfp pilus assembly protein PilF